MSETKKPEALLNSEYRVKIILKKTNKNTNKSW